MTLFDEVSHQQIFAEAIGAILAGARAGAAE
jgi:hypothetical protein